MDSVPTSFIPKQSLITRPTQKRSVGLVMLIAIVLLVLSLGLYGAARLYQSTLGGQIVQLGRDLEKTQSAFSPELLGELERFDTRMTAADDLMNRHVTLLPLFDFLGTQTLKTLRFRNFNISLNPTNPKIEMKMNGEARDYQAIALQSDVFTTSKQLKDFFFSDLNLDAAGRVVFNFSATVDPPILLYAEALRAVATAEQATR